MQGCFYDSCIIHNSFLIPHPIGNAIKTVLAKTILEIQLVPE